MKVDQIQTEWASSYKINCFAQTSTKSRSNKDKEKQSSTKPTQRLVLSRSCTSSPPQATSKDYD